jgi:cytoskeletal protein CcmA (bactofilin family)
MNEFKLRRTRDQSSGKATLINEGCNINGEVSGNGDFMISGKVIGDGDVNGTISVTISGYWQGAIQADNVIVAGHVEGDVTAGGKVEITSTARISGSVTGESIAVAEGAVVEGVMRTTGNAEPLEFIEKRDD